jgi:2-hydroxychromene-2-carboxylate isomerase
MEPIRFYFDFISPYAYLAWTQIRTIADRRGQKVQAVPILFAALLDAHGTKGPAEIPAKRRYLFKDVARKALRFRVPVSPPVAHPFNPLLALRAASVVEADRRDAAIDALYSAFWANRRTIDTADAIASILGEAGFDGASVAAAAQTQQAKDTLRIATDEAIRRGVFGVPTMEVGSELFWGTDSLVDLELFLDGKTPPMPDVGDIPSTAVRKGAHA